MSTRLFTTTCGFGTPGALAASPLHQRGGTGSAFASMARGHGEYVTKPCVEPIMAVLRNVQMKREGNTLWLGVTLTESGNPSASGQTLVIGTGAGKVADFLHPVTKAPVKFNLNVMTANPDYVESADVAAAKEALRNARIRARGFRPIEE